MKSKLPSGKRFETIDELFESFIRPEIVKHGFGPYQDQPWVSGFEGFVFRVSVSRRTCLGTEPQAALID